MGLQARAEITRSKIVDAAVELFAYLGYGETGLAEILQRADVTKGAFYYHFDSKEAVASAIIDEAYQRIVGESTRVIESSSPALENIVRATFAVACVMDTDRKVQVGKQLAQSLTQVSERGPKAFLDWTDLFVGQVAAAIAQAGSAVTWTPRRSARPSGRPCWAPTCCPTPSATTSTVGWHAPGGCCWPASSRRPRCRTSGISSPVPTGPTRRFP